MSTKDLTSQDDIVDAQDLRPSPSLTSMAALTKLFDVTAQAVDALANNRKLNIDALLGGSTSTQPAQRAKKYRADSGLLFPCEGPSEVILDELPVGNYQIVPTKIGLALKAVDPLTIPKKIYGDVFPTRDRIFETFMSREAGTGVILRGDKGSGKTILAKALSVKAAEQGIPTITINEVMCGDEFNRFIQSLGRAVVVFDEFEKVYNKREHQEALLTLLDGTYPSPKLFVFTSNDSYALNDQMNNRPGRIFYSIRYAGMPMDAIKAYLEDRLEDKKYLNLMLQVCQAFGKMNFDSLQAIVEEMNRYKEHPRMALRLLNTSPETSGTASYTGNLSYNGISLRMATSDTHWSHSPIYSQGNNFNIVVSRLTPEAAEALAPYLKVAQEMAEQEGQDNKDHGELMEAGIDPDDFEQVAHAQELSEIRKTVTYVRTASVKDDKGEDTDKRKLVSFTVTFRKEELVDQDPMKGTLIYVKGGFTASFTSNASTPVSLLDTLWDHDERQQKAEALAAANKGPSNQEQASELALN